jgi:ribonucleoside-diphosphate reductase alpha chain
MSLQYGVPLEVYVNKFSHTRFEPMGFTKNPDIRIAKSMVDYIFRWLGMTFLPAYREALPERRARPVTIAGRSPSATATATCATTAATAWAARKPPQPNRESKTPANSIPPAFFQ